MKRKSKLLLSGIVSLFLVVVMLVATACGAATTVAENQTTGNETVETVNDQTADTTDTTDTTDETQDAVTEYTVTFVTDEHVTVIVYDTQDVSGAGTESNTAYARSSDTGAIVTDGSGQVNYVLQFDDGYELSSIEATPTANYNKNKSDPESDGSANYYRLTKVSGDVTITVSSQVSGAEEDLTQGYQVTFVTDGHATVTVYATQALTNGTVSTVAYSRDSSSGLLTKTNGQVNFVVTADDGYEVLSVEATPTDNYKNLKNDPEGDDSDDYYRLTKISGEVTVTIVTQAK